MMLMRWTQRMRFEMSTLLRAVTGVILVTILSYVIIASPSPPFPQAAGIVLIGVVGGLIIGSWWAIPIPPTAMMVTAILWRRIECADCRPGESVESPVWLDLIVPLGLMSITAASAAIGVFAVKSVSGQRSWALALGVLTPLLGPGFAYELRDAGVIDLGDLAAYSVLFAWLGLAAGLLTGRWWIVLYAAVIGIGWPMAFDTSFYGDGPPGLVRGSIVYGILPFAAGSSLGVLLMRNLRDGDRSDSIPLPN